MQAFRERIPSGRASGLLQVGAAPAPKRLTSFLIQDILRPGDPSSSQGRGAEEKPQQQQQQQPPPLEGPPRDAPPIQLKTCTVEAPGEALQETFPFTNPGRNS